MTANVHWREVMGLLGIELQKANIWKRISALMFDSVIWVLLAMLIALLLSGLLGYEDHAADLRQSYQDYATQYGISFDISQQEYDALPEAEKANYDAAYKALTEDKQVLYTYELLVNLTLVIASVGILVAAIVLEFAVPVVLKNGQTLGKKIFAVGVVRTDGVQVTPMQMFIRAILGKFAVETMIPVYVLVMIFFNFAGPVSVILVCALFLGQLISLGITRTNSAIHDLLAGTATVDIASQRIFATTQDLVEYTKKLHAEQAARESY